MDRTSSRRAPFLFGLILNAAATALLCFATDVRLLLLSRALQGFSAAIVYTVGFAMLADTVGSKGLGEWMGYNITSVNIGITASPTVGGLVYDHFGYYPIFGILAVLIGLDIILRLVLVENRHASGSMEEEGIYTGQHPSTQYGTTEPVATSQQENPSTNSRDDLSSEHHEASGPSKDAESIRRQETSSPTKSNTSTEEEDSSDASSERPTYPPPLLIILSSPRILADLYATFVTVSLLVSFDSALPIYLERTFGWGSTGGGLVFFTLTLPILGAPLAGKLTDRYQSRWIPATGFIILGALTALLQLVKSNSPNQIALLVSLLTLNGMYCNSVTYITEENATKVLTGCVRVISSAPLGADLYRAIKEMDQERPGIFGKSGATGQLFSLYTMASAAGVCIGPLWTSFAYGDQSWTFLVSSLGIVCASVAVPLVSTIIPRHGLCGCMLTKRWRQIVSIVVSIRRKRRVSSSAA